MKVDGACHCGAITVEGEIDPGQVVICHCTDCQTGTGSAFQVSVPFRQNIQSDRKTHNLPQDNSRQRQSARPRVLSNVRHAHLLDNSRERSAGSLYAARWHLETAP
jgi:hypothetical protein